MRNYFSKQLHLRAALAATFLCGLCMPSLQESSVKTDDKSRNYIEVTIFSEPRPPHRRLIHPAEYQLAPKDGTAGYIQLMPFSEDEKTRIKGEKLEVVSFPEFDYREGPNDPIRNWPMINWPTIETISMESWIEYREDERGIKMPTTFRLFKAVLSSSTAGIHNKVTIFATDHDYHHEKTKKEVKDKIKLNKQWIVVDVGVAEKIFNHIEAGSDVIIRIESPDSY